MAAQPRARVAQLVLAAMITLCGFTAAGPLMAIDFGSDFIKVAVVPPGKLPEIVTNEMTKRRTSAQVAIVDGNRLLGEEAAALAVRYPTKVYSRLREWIGKSAKDSSVAAALQGNLLPFSIVPDPNRGTVAVKTDADGPLSSEELLASIFHYARGITQAFAGAGQVLDCVITVPAFFGQSQRAAVIDAAKLAGLNVLSLVNSHAAAALQHGITQDFTNKSEHVIFYDVGASSVEAALIKYSSFDVKQGAKTMTHSQFEVKDVAWDSTAGVQHLDILLVNHFADQFEKKHPGADVRGSPRAIAKLAKQARRTKEMLSANTEAPFIVEELLDGKDFRSSIKRAELEALAGPFFEKTALPLQQLLQRNGLAPRDLQAVELLGGGSRVPAVQAALTQVLQGRSLDKHLDADEAIVRGAALYAANLSTTFRLNRKFGMADGVVYPVSFKLSEDTKVRDSEREGAFKPKTLLPYMKRVPVKRVVHLPNVTADPIKFSLLYNLSQGTPLPPGAPSEELASYTLTGLETVLSKYNTTGKISVHFSTDSSSLLKVEKAESVIELWEQYEVEVPVETSEDNSTVEARETLESAADATDEEPSVIETGANETTAGSNETAAASPVPTTKEIRTRKKTFRVPLTVGGPGFVMPAMTPEQLKAGKQKLEQMQQAEQGRAEAAHAKNELEAYIISTQSRLSSDEDVEAVTSQQQRESFNAALSEVEEWLYDQGQHEQAPLFRQKLSKLKETGDAISLRAAELGARPEALTLARQVVDLNRQQVQDWPSSKPWINATDSNNLLAEFEAFSRWLDSEEEQQSKLGAHEEPSLLSSVITARVSQMQSAFEKLNKKKKPAPPPPPPKDKNQTGNATADGSNQADGQPAEPDAQSKPSEQQQDQQSSASSGKSSKQKEKKDKVKAEKEKKSSKGKDNGKKKAKNRDLEDLKSKLPPDLKTFNFNDLHDLDSLKAKLEEMKLSKEGGSKAEGRDEL